MIVRTAKRRAVAGAALTVAMLIVSGCGGSGGAAPLALGTAAVVDHTQLSGANAGPKTSLAVTVRAVRTGTVAELEAGGFDLDADQKQKTPFYVDWSFENKGTQAIDQHLDVGMEDQDGKLITSVAIINLGGDKFQPCPDNREGSLAPAQKVDTCTLFLVAQGRTPTKISFLPYDPGKETDFVYWNAK